MGIQVKISALLLKAAINALSECGGVHVVSVNLSTAILMTNHRQRNILLAQRIRWVLA